MNESGRGDDAPVSSRRDGVDEAADATSGFLSMVRSAKARASAGAGEDVESATRLLLRTLARQGPIRASDLAVLVGADLSTVSRQVAALVAAGVVARSAHPDDGRVCLLAVTDSGRTVIRHHDEVRRRFFEQVLEGWEAAEISRFARALARFTQAYDETQAAWASGPTHAAPQPRPRAE